MAQEKEERPTAGAKRAGDSVAAAAADDPTRKASAPQTRTASRESGNGGNEEPAVLSPASRRERYLIGTRRTQGPQPFGLPHQQRSMNDVVEYLNHQENVEVVRRIKLGSTRPFAPEGRDVDNEVVVAKIGAGKAVRLQTAAPPDLIVERDCLLACAEYLAMPARSRTLSTLLPLRATATDVVIRVLGERDQPLPKAMVVIDGCGLPAQALTDETGTARLSYFGESADTIHMLFVRSQANHWDLLVRTPRLDRAINLVKLRPLSQVHAGFPNERLLGWGQRVMGIDPAGGRFTGAGVKIGIIDSGCDNTHPLLRHITQGKDFTGAAGAATDNTSWTQDPLSHGTHCAGIINARSTEQGISGCAPEAEVHVFKVSPGARVSDLLAALDECLERELDVVNIGVVSEGFSELVGQKLQELRQAGIACIVAAGNTGGPVAFPATVPGVMAVAAVGKLGEFPPDSSHALDVIPQFIGGDGIFAASFSGVGSQIAVSAPGVAIVSTVPGGGYAAADGTSVAAAHVTGLAALILAHHPLFSEESAYANARSEHRVHTLFELIRASALPYFPDPQRIVGAGIPSLSRVPGAHSVAMGPLQSERLDQLAMSRYRPLNLQGWPSAPPLF